MPSGFSPDSASDPILESIEDAIEASGPGFRGVTIRHFPAPVHPDGEGNGEAFYRASSTVPQVVSDPTRTHVSPTELHARGATVQAALVSLIERIGQVATEVSAFNGLRDRRLQIVSASEELRREA